MPVTIPLGVRSRVIIGHSSEMGWYAVRWRKPPSRGWDEWDPRWDDGPPDGGVREPRRPSPSPLQGAAELPEPD